MRRKFQKLQALSIQSVKCTTFQFLHSLTMRSLCIHHWLTVQFCSVHTVDMSTWSHVNKLNWIVYIFMINPKLLRINRSPWIHCSHCAYVWVHLTKPAHWVLFSFQTRTAHLSTRLLTFFCSAFTLLSCEKYNISGTVHIWSSL